VTNKPTECAGCEVGMRVHNGVHIDRDGHKFMTCERESEINQRWEAFSDDWLRRIPIT
jgi:hypothetical protein